MVNGGDDLSAFRILLDCGVWRDGGLCVGMATDPLQSKAIHQVAASTYKGRLAGLLNLATEFRISAHLHIGIPLRDLRLQCIRRHIDHLGEFVQRLRLLHNVALDFLRAVFRPMVAFNTARVAVLEVRRTTGNTASSS